ncbi:serine hydrolase domain-containing protein [Sphingobacterium gobiense]|uniref:Beta-lactamase-related domain-containing protein n=1 Tax=Sphingobacterium gobiense TaxID=1382456 RepID=A0A2S9JTS2_9SPHI|nr:serine hydrolase domain-containing protein [Sphingobacterium gobiense]PRD56630.1 hypothetical protein C5749_05190 [Sphingobacterium gobiense]
MKKILYQAILFCLSIHCGSVYISAQPKQIERMDSLLQSFIDNGKTNVVAAYVAKGGDVLYHKAFGYKDFENKIPASVDDYYVLFSQTKAVISVAFMTLVDKGLVSVDDPVANYFPGIPDQIITTLNEDGTYETRTANVPMTFVHLMAHSSGLGAGQAGALRRKRRPQEDRPPGFAGHTDERKTTGQRTMGVDGEVRYLKDEMEALAKYPLGFEPGSEYNYHVSTNMLAYMIGRISGKPLREYVKETILIPLGMNDTDWYYPADKLDRFVKPYNYVDGKLEKGTTMYAEGAVSPVQTYCEGAIGLNGPIGDYAKFCQMLLNKGEYNGVRILKAETVDAMTTINRLPAVNSGGKGFQFGLGFELHNPNRKPLPEVSNSAYSWGGMLGTAYIIDPQNDMTALFYLNMFKKEELYPLFLKEVYHVIKP